MTNVQRILFEAKSRVKSFLPNGKISEDQARKILQQYAAAIEGNFVAWMGAAVITSRSVQGRYAASENLWVEMQDDHAGMLHEFVKSVNAEPGKDDFELVSDAVYAVRLMIAEMSGLKNLTLMAFLENSSEEFIPLLESLAIQLHAPSLKYTQTHGVADVAHADQFIWALEHEAVHYNESDKIIEDAVTTSFNFLETLFKI